MVRNVSWVLLVALGSANCASPFGPSEYGLPVPRDPGRIIVRVLDHAGAPVQNAYACIEQPSAVGNQFKTCSWTGPDGMTLPHTVASGRRPVDVTLPAGFSAGPEGLIREVDLVKDRTVTVDFNVRRN